MRLIDERELIRRISELPDLRTINTGTIGKIIKECSTIDAVQVVRCKDCVYRNIPKCCPYQINGIKVTHDWYCPMGVTEVQDG